MMGLRAIAPSIHRRKTLSTLLALLPLALLWPGLRHAIEGSMALHMLLQFPLLLAAGWAAARLLPARTSPQLQARWHRLDAHGLAGATFASAVAAFWMVPAALDLALLEPGIAALKYASWALAGLLLAWAWPRMAAETALFFLGNLVWMLATAGLLYREAELRLCVNYLLGDQALAGTGLLAGAVGIGCLVLLRIARAPATR